MTADARAGWTPQRDTPGPLRVSPGHHTIAPVSEPPAAWLLTQAWAVVSLHLQEGPTPAAGTQAVLSGRKL